MIEYLFVYGTLRQGAGHPLAQLLDINADYLGKGFVRGLLYLVDSYPGMVLSNNPKNLVCGDLYRLLPGTTLLQTLDDYEECAPEHPKPTEYLRRQAQITTEQGEILTAWLYLYNRPIDTLTRIESGDFLREQRLSG